MDSTQYRLNNIDQNWYKSTEGISCIQQLFVHGTKQRKQFGLLERPSLAPGILELDYKIALFGKSGSGKSRLVSLLSGYNKQDAVTVETTGIHVKDTYWPAKLNDKVVLFKLQFWDHGENIGKKYSYIVPGSLEKADAVAFVVNTNDKTSLDYVSHQIENLKKDPGKNYMIFGIVFNVQPDLPVEVFKEDLEKVEKQFKINFCYVPVLSPSVNANSAKFLVPCFSQLCDILYSKLSRNL